VDLENWFGELAWVVVERFVLRDDYEQTYNEAITALKCQFEKSKETAEECLENAFILAKDTGRSEEFERPSTPVTILYRKLPYLADRWAEQKAKQSLKTGDNQTFQNFMDWLKLKQKVSEQIGRQKAIEGQRIGKGPTKSNTATAATHVTVPQQKNGGAWGQQKVSFSRPPQQKAPFYGPPPQKAPFKKHMPDQNKGVEMNSNCSMCNNPHPLELCSKFKVLNAEQRFAHCKVNRACFICLGRGHLARYCKK
jgi:hypothetical protein